ncbi:MAG: DUF479 domain-containing protein [Ferruginibacter sp.]|nr:DUF479 domain-containing protein [Ferruginibacter sp.]
MNFLAHAYLSFGHPEMLLGNMISDFVKGKKQFDYPENVQRGISLHRFIDTFTDEHPATRSIKQFFKPKYGKYSGAFADVVYDYFLANDNQSFEDETLLSVFATNTYTLLSQQAHLFPSHFELVFQNMQQQNWLLNYGKKWGIEKSFGGLVRRAKYLDDPRPAFSIFENNLFALKQLYDDFFPAVKQYALDKIESFKNM